MSRIHAGSIRQVEFLNVVRVSLSAVPNGQLADAVLQAFSKCQSALARFATTAKGFESSAVAGLLLGAPDMSTHLAHIKGMYRTEEDGRSRTSGYKCQLTCHRKDDPDRADARS